MKSLRSLMIAGILGFGGYAQAGVTPGVFQVEVPGHLSDGIDEIVTVYQSGDQYSVIKAYGSYDWRTGKLNYLVTQLGSDMKCGETSGNFVCSKDDRYVDGPLTVISFICRSDTPNLNCDVIKSITTVDMLNGDSRTINSVILKNANRI